MLVPSQGELRARDARDHTPVRCPIKIANNNVHFHPRSKDASFREGEKAPIIRSDYEMLTCLRLWKCPWYLPFESSLKQQDNKRASDARPETMDTAGSGEAGKDSEMFGHIKFQVPKNLNSRAKLVNFT